MAKLSEEVKKAIADNYPAIIATASRSGKPNVSAKGSFRVVDDDHVAFADIRSPRTIANLEENPQISVLLLNPQTRKGCRLWGKAEILTSGPVFDKIAQEYAAKNTKVNHVVSVAVDEATAF